MLVEVEMHCGAGDGDDGAGSRGDEPLAPGLGAGSGGDRVGSLSRNFQFRLQLQRPGSVSYRGDEAIADTGDGLDVAGRGGRVPEGVAKFLDGLVEAVIEVDKDVGGPEALAEFVAGDDFAGALEEQSQELQRLLRQGEFGPVPAELPGFEIELKEAKVNHGLRRRNRQCKPPSAAARTEFSIWAEEVAAPFVPHSVRGQLFISGCWVRD
jgi:hypothetical protein